MNFSKMLLKPWYSLIHYQPKNTLFENLAGQSTLEAIGTENMQ